MGFLPSFKRAPPTIGITVNVTINTDAIVTSQVQTAVCKV